MNFDQLSNEELAVAKVKCDRNLLYFTRFWFRILRGSKFIVNWHHETICDALEEVSKYKYKLLNINIPPRFSKTELAGINFIAQALAKNPRANFLYITASDELRSETSIRIRDIVTHPMYTRMFGVEMKKDQSGKNLWRTNQGGGLKTATIFGQITGFGAGRMVQDNRDLLDYIKDFEGAIILDDINKIIDSQSDNANNKKSIDTIFSTILSRVNSKETPIINIQQRAGLNDATEALLDYFDESETKSIVLPIIIDNEPLWAFKQDLKGIDKLRTHEKTAHVFQTQYMQDPQPSEGVLFPKDRLNTFKLSEFNKENVISSIGAIDTADDGTDFFAFPILKKAGDKWYLVDVMYTQDNLEITKPLSLAKIEKHKLDYVKVETNSQGKDYYRYLKTNVSNASTRGVFSVQNKETRILMQSGWIMDNVIFRRDYEVGSDYDKFMTDLTRYLKMAKGQKDDAPDSLAAAAQFIKKIFGEI